MAAMSGLGRLYLLCAAALFLVATVYPVAVGAQDDLLITCYWYDGKETPKNTKCPNTNTCCGPQAACLSNGLCHNPGADADEWVRGPCANKDWEGCAQVCMYNEAFGIFPRVKECADGRLCCNNDAECCDKGTGVFLDNSGRGVSTRPTDPLTTYTVGDDGLARQAVTPSTSTAATSTDATDTTTTTSSASATTTDETTPADTTSTSSTNPAATETTAPPNATQDASSSQSDSSPSGDNTIALKIGLGLGIPLAVLVTACVVYFLVRRRYAARSAAGGGAGGDEAQYPPSTSSYVYAPEMATPGHHQHHYYSDVPKPPAELAQAREMGELDGGVYGYELGGTPRR